LNLSKFFVHTATYWTQGMPDGFGGYSWGSPIEYSVRWEDRNEKFIDEEGVEKLSQAVVYTNQDLAVGDYLYKGSSAASDPTTLTDAYPINQTAVTPSVDGSQSLVKAYLKG